MSEAAEGSRPILVDLGNGLSVVTRRASTEVVAQILLEVADNHPFSGSAWGGAPARFQAFCSCLGYVLISEWRGVCPDDPERRNGGMMAEEPAFATILLSDGSRALRYLHALGFDLSTLPDWILPRPEGWD
ncbi:hypothetical protein [Minwuia thermotolerans]|uniref:Uncharacterized protein n=1 Tax=Minwuia thermotolerans TaxID=2056226 RepID=A0A2M9G2J1_9PROT|nr:hypothetical protein [Minwuia thermotolerans]PJK29939.1 hypothetical protein CVT23_09225 [Minwuia thermotolerans]